MVVERMNNIEDMRTLVQQKRDLLSAWEAELYKWEEEERKKAIEPRINEETLQFSVLDEEYKDNGYRTILRRDTWDKYDLVDIEIPLENGKNIRIRMDFEKTNKFNLWVTHPDYKLVSTTGSHYFRVEKKER